MNTFVVGQKVGFLKEKGEAIIQEIIDKNWVLITDELGFIQKRQVSDLIRVFGSDYQLENLIIPSEKVKSKQVKKSIPAIKQIKKETTWEIDLHIEKITTTHTALSNTEILIKQLHTFRSKFLSARESRIQRLIVIHGVGEGVLKGEIHAFLHKQDSISYHEASFHNYGKGATEIKFFISNF